MCQADALFAQSFERRWHRFFGNGLIRVNRLYIPLVLLALIDWQSHRRVYCSRYGACCGIVTA
ncbi:MAG: hypothetical protein F6K26_52995 [Moorea sp. SIO2I5]|nr:hypothetical protein [Moorena sp. SIO2I5]